MRLVGGKRLKRASKGLKKGEIKKEDITLGGAGYLYMHHVKDGVLDAIDLYLKGKKYNNVIEILIPMDNEELDELNDDALEECDVDEAQQPAVRAYIQIDNAPGHGTKRGKKGGPRADTENLVGAKKLARARGIQIVHQPANSPDTQICDRNLWTSLKAKFNENLYRLPDWKDVSEQEMEDAMWELVKEAWQNLEPRAPFNGFRAWEEDLQVLIDTEGKSLRNTSHHGIREKWGTYEP